MYAIRSYYAYEFAAAVAATLAPAAAQHCAQDCIQVHGGIGFTWEHDTNVYYRHTLANIKGPESTRAYYCEMSQWKLMQMLKRNNFV